MKLLVLSLMFTLSTLAIAEEPFISARDGKQISKLKSRCEWAASIPVELDWTTFLKQLDEAERTHPSLLAKIGAYWDAKATKDLSVVLEHLSQRETRRKIDLSDEVHQQYGLYYLENLSAIKAMVDRLSIFPAEIAAKRE